MTNNMVMRSINGVEARRISPNDSNYFVILFDTMDSVDVVCVVEIFAVGGMTPPNSHQIAHEFFYVLSGSGRAVCDGKDRDFSQGDALMLRPGAEHVIENTGAGKLYTLTFMVPNEEFAELIRAGEIVELDDEDISTLMGVSGERLNA